MKKFLVSWIEGGHLGIYEAQDADGAILAAVKNAGYASLDRAASFIRDDNGALTLEAVEAEKWEAWLDGQRSCSVNFYAPVGGTFDIAQAGAEALGVEVCEELNTQRV